MSQAKLLVVYGKPMGFWYAYGEDWKKFVNTGAAGRNTNATAFRYVFSLPEHAFTTDVSDPSHDSILELSQSNIDAFMNKYAKNSYRTPHNTIVERAFDSLIMDGESAVLNELFEINDEFAEYCEELMYSNDINMKKVMKTIKKQFPNVMTFSPSNKALKSDGIFLFDWPAFWEGVSSTLGGVEFHADVFDMDTWDGIELPWTRKLDIRSGVIFHPATFHDGILQEQLEKPVLGGKIVKRRTLRNKHKK